MEKVSFQSRRIDKGIMVLRSQSSMAHFMASKLLTLLQYITPYTSNSSYKNALSANACDVRIQPTSQHRQNDSWSFDSYVIMDILITIWDP
jgi:hypothetical protein